MATNLGTFGLGTSVRRPSGASPANLLNIGASQQRTASGMMGDAATAEARREMANKEAQQQSEAGGAQLGSTAGAMAGFQVGGPVGALIGGVLGAIAGKDLF